jgi:hypothetical protein
MLQLLIDFFSQLVDDVAVVLRDGPEHGVRKAIRNHENSNADLAVLLPPDISVLYHDRDIVGFDALAVDAAVVAEEGDVLCACVSLRLLRTKQSYRKESLFCTRLREAEGCSCLFHLALPHGLEPGGRTYAVQGSRRSRQMRLEVLEGQVGLVLVSSSASMVSLVLSGQACWARYRVETKQCGCSGCVRRSPRRR